MNKLQKLLAVLALFACATGCAETTADGRAMTADMDHGPAVAAGDPAPRAVEVSARSSAWREPTFASRPVRSEILVCAQCR